MPAHCKWDDGTGCVAHPDDAFLATLESSDRTLYDALRRACTRQRDELHCEAGATDHTLCRFADGSDGCVVADDRWDRVSSGFGGAALQQRRLELLRGRCASVDTRLQCNDRAACAPAEFMDEAGACRPLSDVFAFEEWGGACDAATMCPHSEGAHARPLYDERGGTRPPPGAPALACGFGDEDEIRRACDANAICAAYHVPLDGGAAAACLYASREAGAPFGEEPGEGATFVRYPATLLAEVCPYTCAKSAWEQGMTLAAAAGGEPGEDDRDAQGGGRAPPPVRGEEGEPGSCWVRAEGCGRGFVGFPRERWARDWWSEARGNAQNDRNRCLARAAVATTPGDGAARGACESATAHWIAPWNEDIEFVEQASDDVAPQLERDPFDDAARNARLCARARAPGATNVRGATNQPCSTLSRNKCEAHFEQCPRGMRKNTLGAMGQRWVPLAARDGADAAAGLADLTAHWEIQYAALEQADVPNIAAGLREGRREFASDESDLAKVDEHSVLRVDGRWFAPVPFDRCYRDDEQGRGGDGGDGSDGGDEEAALYACVLDGAECRAREIFECTAPALDASSLERDLVPLNTCPKSSEWLRDLVEGYDTEDLPCEIGDLPDAEGCRWCRNKDRAEEWRRDMDAHTLTVTVNPSRAPNHWRVRHWSASGFFPHQYSRYVHACRRECDERTNCTSYSVRNRAWHEDLEAWRGENCVYRRERDVPGHAPGWGDERCNSNETVRVPMQADVETCRLTFCGERDQDLVSDPFWDTYTLAARIDNSQLRTDGWGTPLGGPGVGSVSDDAHQGQTARCGGRS